MFSISCIFSLVILSVIQVSFTLVPLPHVENNDILNTEDVIRSTTNTLFSSLGLIKSRNPKLEQFNLVHNYFISITLLDYHNLKEIAKLTRFNKTNIDNITTDLIDVINKITERYLNLNKLTSFEVHAIEKAQKKTKFIKAFYNDNQLDEIVLKILEDDTNTNDFKNTSLRNQSSAVQNNTHILDKKLAWRGHKVGRRLYNAKSTKIKHFGFMASVEIFNRFQCAGNIIKSDLVITAASCLQLAHNNRFFRENPPFLTVRVGSTYFEVGGEVIKVIEIYFYPTYDPKSLHHNIAIMRLHRRLRFHKKAVKKIEIDHADSNLPYNVGRITIVGWGAKTTSNALHNPWKSKLRYAEIDVYDLHDCQDIYSKEYVTSKNFCAGYMSHGSGACNRDVGGPGIARGKLVGIISFGAPVCGTPDAPTVFVKVGYYYDWIEDIMGQEVPYVKQKTTLKPKTYTYGPPNSNDYHSYRITPIYKKQKQTFIGREMTDASRYKKIPRPQNKKMSIRDFLKTMFTDDEIKEALGDPISQSNISTIEITQKVTQYIYDNPYFQNTAQGEPVSFNAITGEQYVTNMEIDNFSVTTPEPMKFTVGIADYNEEDNEYSGLQVQETNSNKYEDTVTAKNIDISMATQNIENSSMITQFMVPVTDITRKPSNVANKELQDIVLEYLEQPNIFTIGTTANFPKEQLVFKTKFGVNTLNVRQKQINLSAKRKETTKQIGEENIGKLEEEIYTDLYPILTDKESKNETLTLLLDDYIMKFNNHKKELNANNPGTVLSVGPSSQNINNGIITKTDMPKGMDEPIYHTTDKTHGKRLQRLSSSSIVRGPIMMGRDNKNSVTLTRTTTKYLSKTAGKLKDKSPKRGTSPSIYNKYNQYSTEKYNEEGFGLPSTVSHFSIPHRYSSTSSDKNKRTKTKNYKGRSTQGFFKEYYSFTPENNNEGFYGTHPTEFQTSQRHFPTTFDKFHNSKPKVQSSPFVGKKRFKQRTTKTLVNQVELSKYLSKDDIADIVHKKKIADKIIKSQIIFD